MVHFFVVDGQIDVVAEEVAREAVSFVAAKPLKQHWHHIVLCRARILVHKSPRQRIVGVKSHVVRRQNRSEEFDLLVACGKGHKVVSGKSAGPKVEPADATVETSFLEAFIKGAGFTFLMHFLGWLYLSTKHF